MWNLLQLGLSLLLANSVYCQNVPHTVTAPMYIRLDTPTTLVVNLHGVNGMVNIGGTLDFKVNKEAGFTQIPNVANQAANLPIEVIVTYTRDNFVKKNIKQYVEATLVATSGNTQIKLPSVKMEVLVDSGYIEIMTDRPVYRPNEFVQFSVISMNQDLNPETNREVEITLQVPPDYVGVSRKNLQMPLNKFIEDRFPIPELPQFGIWRIQAKFTNGELIQHATRDFMVQRYVVPTFNVDIIIPNLYILTNGNRDIEEIQGTIKAVYSYGELINGYYYLVGKIKRPVGGGNYEDQTFFNIPGELDRKAPFNDGEHHFAVPVNALHNKLREGETFQTWQENGVTVFFEATVVNEADGIIESSISKQLQFTPSPYKIDISRMSAYFTPGLTFPIKADVIDIVSRKPVAGVRVIISIPGEEPEPVNSDENGQIYYTHSMPNDKVVKEIVLQTRVIGLGDEGQARTVVNLFPYDSPSGNFIQLTSRQQLAKFQNNMFEVNAHFNAWKHANVDIRFMVLARGEVAATGRAQPEVNQREAVLRFPITHDMVPAIRVIAYYKLPNGEIVSNSLWLDVENKCKTELTIKVKEEEILPGDEYEVTYTGAPGALLRVSAVDRGAYFLYNDSRLSRDELFESMDEYDMGCLRQGGRNGAHVFEVSGFQIVGGTSKRKEEFRNPCNNRRKKRSTNKCPRPTIPDDGHINPNKESYDIGETVTYTCRTGFEISLPGGSDGTVTCNDRLRWDGGLPVCEETYSDRCQLDALIKNDDLTCEERAKKVERNYEGDDNSKFGCAEKYLEICKANLKRRTIGRSSSRARGRAQNDAAAAQKQMGKLRSDFSENMLWRIDKILPDGKLTRNYQAVDSITTFEFDAVSLHETEGFCVAQTDYLKLFKKIFIQMQTPYALKKMEQLDIRITVFNYGDKKVDVRLNVIVGEHLCSHFPMGKATWLQTVSVQPGEARASSFTILPLRVPTDNEGKVTLEIHGYDDSNGDVFDKIRKDILVEPEGDIKEFSETKAFKIKDSIENFPFNFNFPVEASPGTKKCTLYAYSNYMGPIIQMDAVTKQPRDIGSLMGIPTGCGEQTMIRAGPTTYAFKYMRSVGKMPEGSAEETAALDKIRAGYANELKHRSKAVGYRAFAVWASHQPSVWLNAFVCRVFARAQKCGANMDMGPIRSAYDWMTSMQDDTGFFNKGNRVYHTEMHGAVGGPLTLTAYCLISLIEGQHLVMVGHDALKQKIFTASDKAVSYLRMNRNHAQMNTPYVLALTAYALTLAQPADPLTTEICDRLWDAKRMSDDGRLIFWKAAPLAQVDAAGIHNYWHKRKSSAVDVEATAYALLAMLQKIQMKQPHQVTQDDIVNLKKIATWLIEQRDHHGAFTTTQDTVVGLQALSEYMVWAKDFDPPSPNVAIDLSYSGAPGTEWEQPHMDQLTNDNENFTIPLEVPQTVVNQQRLNVRASGTGEGTISYRCTYRTVSNVDLCQFNLEVTPARLSDTQFKLTITVSKPEGDPTGQAIIRINLLTGFKPFEPSLEILSKTFNLAGEISRYEITNQNVILYLDDIGSEDITFSFIMQNVLQVQKIQPATVTVYQYYEPSITCTKQYSAPDELKDLRTSKCRGPQGDGEDMCTCAEGGCIKCRYRKSQLSETQCINTDGACNICKYQNPLACFNMVDKACKSSFVYKIKVTKEVPADAQGVFVDFEAEILQVLKPGIDVEARERNQIRRFRLRNDCYHDCVDPDLNTPDKQDTPLSWKFFKLNRELTMWGFEEPSRVEKNGQIIHTYLLQSGTFIERTIPEKKCRRARQNRIKFNCVQIGQGGPNEDVCDDALKTIQACEALLTLIQKIFEGCDNHEGK